MAVTIVLNGYAGTPATQTINTDKTDTKISDIITSSGAATPTPVDPGFNFSHWGWTVGGDTKIGDSTIAQASASGITTGDILNIYANYVSPNSGAATKKTLNITLNPGAGGINGQTGTKQYAIPVGASFGYALDKYSIPMPTRAGYTFQGWANPDGKIVNATAFFNTDITLNATWISGTYTTSNITIKTMSGDTLQTFTGFPITTTTKWADVVSKITAKPAAVDKTVDALDFGADGYTGSSFTTLVLNTTPIAAGYEWSITGTVNGTAVTIEMVNTTRTGRNSKGLWINGVLARVQGGAYWSGISTLSSIVTLNSTTNTLTFKGTFYVTGKTGTIPSGGQGLTAKSVPQKITWIGQPFQQIYMQPDTYIYPKQDLTLAATTSDDVGYTTIGFKSGDNSATATVTRAAGSTFSSYLAGINVSSFVPSKRVLAGWKTSYFNLVPFQGIDNDSMVLPNGIIFESFSIDDSVVTVTNTKFDANGGTFYTGTPYETGSISIPLEPNNTFGKAADYIPAVTKGKMRLLHWVTSMKTYEPAYTQTVDTGDVVYAKWSIEGTNELYRLPREFYLIDEATIYHGWDQMDKFSLSQKDLLFVIDPTGLGVSYSDQDLETNDGWDDYTPSISRNNIEFTAYYMGYDAYRKLGRWMRGKRLVLAMLNETSVPTYWFVEKDLIERTEIKHESDILSGKLSFTKKSPAFDLEFLGIGTDNTVSNADDDFRRNAYVYLHSLQIPDDDNGVEIIAKSGNKTIEDAVKLSLPAGSYIEYSTVPFREKWAYGSKWEDCNVNLYNYIMDLTFAQPLKLGIGTWDISMSSSTKRTIDSLGPNKNIAFYKGTTIDGFGGTGSFVGIAIKEKEI